MRMFMLSSHYVKEGHGLGRGVHFVIQKEDTMCLPLFRRYRATSIWNFFFYYGLVARVRH